MQTLRTDARAGSAPYDWRDPAAAVALGPGAVLIAPPLFASERLPWAPPLDSYPAGVTGRDWLLELFELEGETVRVLIAGGDEG